MKFFRSVEMSISALSKNFFVQKYCVHEVRAHKTWFFGAPGIATQTPDRHDLGIENVPPDIIFRLKKEG